MNKWMQGVAATLTAATLAVGGIGFLHTPMGRKLPIGRKLLGWMGVPCPIDTTHLTAARVEQSRQLGVQALRSKQAAPARPALTGLRLDETSEAESAHWAQVHGISCHLLVRGMHFLKCEEISAGSFGITPGHSPIQTLTLAFNPSGRLVAVDIFRRKLGAEEASAVMLDLSLRLRSRLGAPTEARGALTPASLGGDIMKTAYVNYRFRDYLAMLTATNIPWSGGVAVHEQYSSARLSAP